MIIYNITTQVTWQVHDQWRKWLLTEHIPNLIATGIFSHHQVVRVLEVDDTEGPMYAVQLYVHESCTIDDYKNRFAETMEKSEKALWGNQVFTFSSLMEVIN
jgi:hypothetical protein